jgi:hypothetical protein
LERTLLARLDPSQDRWEFRDHRGFTVEPLTPPAKSDAVIRERGRTTMRYELLFLDRSHRVAERFPFVAPDDVEAKGAAEDLTPAVERELWCGERIVQRWPQPIAEHKHDID